MHHHRVLLTMTMSLLGLTGSLSGGTICDGTETPEGEPVCADGYVDAFNGGFNSTPPAYSSIACGETVCGTTGNFVVNAINNRDTDWYRIVLTESMEITFEATANGFAHALTTVDLQVPGGSVVGQFLMSKAGETLTVTNCLEPGEYALFVSTAGFEGVPCGSEYVATMSCPAGCSLPTIGACCFCGACYEDVDEIDCLSSGGQAWFAGQPCPVVQCPDVDGLIDCFCLIGLGGSCYEPTGTPFCSDPICCSIVCAIDSFCCVNEWDQICAHLALQQCSCEGDFDNSDDVGFGDLLIMLGLWGQCIGCLEDLDFSGTVDFADVLGLIGLWGPCPSPI